MVGGLTTELRAASTARSMSAGLGGHSELRSKAVLALANAASFPYSEGLWELVQEALGWGGPLEEELQESARILRLSKIVQRHHATGFRLIDPTHATRLLRYILARVHCPSALDDALQVSAAYKHLSVRKVYVEFLQNLVGSRPKPREGGSSDSGVDHKFGNGNESHSRSRGEVSRAVAPHGPSTAALAKSGLGGSEDEGSKLAWALETHRARVMAVVKRLPLGEEWPVVQEVILYCVRQLEDFEMDAREDGLGPGELNGCVVQYEAEEGRRPCPLPGSEAEEALFTAAAAGVLVTFLRETQRHPGTMANVGGTGGGRGRGRGKPWVRSMSGPSVGGRSSYVNLSEIAANLQRVQALQTEFGVFPWVATLESTSEVNSGEGGRGKACWMILKGQLLSLEEHMLRSQVRSC
ncbi:unnamed protein product [Choristocarpus tenellus]